MSARKNRHGRLAGLVATAVVLTATWSAFVPTWGQEDDHAAPQAPGRGDVHSPGWKKVEALKGAPVSPRFPAVGESIRREVLPNGLVLYLLEDHSLPLVQAELLVRTGSYYEAPGQLELATLTAQQMRAGGTQAMGAQELTDRLAWLAASVNSGAEDEMGRVSLDVLSEHLAEGMKLFADVALRPAFDPERLQLAKRNVMFQMQHRNDNPQQILQRELNRLMYGPAHPRGRETRPPDVMGIERDALVAFHKSFYAPDRAWLAVVGDFDAAAMQATVRELFGGWEPSGQPVPPLPTASGEPKPGIYVVDRDLNQSSIAVVHWGTKRDDANRYAITLMNTVLGGGSFSSRITERVRSDEGLAYSAGSRYATDGREVGLFQASVQTKTETTVRAIRLILDEISKMQGGTISQNEFETARESLLYSYVFRFDDPYRNVVRLMELELDGLPADTYAKEFRGYQATTRQDMSRVALTALRPQDLSIFVVGDLDAFREELAALGAYRVIEIEEFDIPRGPGGPQGRRSR